MDRRGGLMREIEFLPTWYPTFRRRRGLVAAQTWATAAILAAIGLFGVAEHQKVMAEERAGSMLQHEIAQTKSELKLLDEQLVLKKQLDRQGEILSKVGLQIDFTRLLAELDVMMGGDMFLVEFAADTEEVLRSADNAAANNIKSRAGDKSANPALAKKCDRKLKVKLVAVAPNDVDVANFLAGLTNKAYLDQVAMTYAKDRIQQGRIMREFELTFLINLNTPSAE